MPRAAKSTPPADAASAMDAPAQDDAPIEQSDTVTQENTTATRRPARRRSPRPAAPAPETAVEGIAAASPPVEAETVTSAVEPATEGRERVSAARPRRTAARQPAAPATDAAPATASAEQPAQTGSPTSTSAWAPRRPFTVGPDGRVRYLDETPVAPEAAIPPVPPAIVEPEAPEPMSSTEAVEATTAVAAVDVEEVADDGPSIARRPRGRRGGAGRVTPETQPFSEERAPVDVQTDVVSDALPQELAANTEAGSESDDDQRPRRRRSRRGGRGRRRNGVSAEGEAATDEDDAITELAEDADVSLLLAPEPEPAPRPLRARQESGAALTPLESLTARQNVILDQLMQRQERMARSMEQALKAVEARLKGTDLSRVSAMPRLAVFVDVPNIVYAADRYRVAVDFGKLLEYVSRDRTLIRASAYAPISDDPSQRLEDQRFVEPFVRHGYRIVTKPLKRFADGSIKANFDVELAMDILTMSDRLDIVSLVSGDGDFRRLVDIVASKGVRVEVVSFAQSTSADLKAVADSYIDLTQHLRDLCNPVEGDFRPRVPRPKVDISGYTEGSRLDI